MQRNPTNFLSCLLAVAAVLSRRIFGFGLVFDSIALLHPTLHTTPTLYRIDIRVYPTAFALYIAAAVAFK